MVRTAHRVGYCGLLTTAINNYYSTDIDFTSSKSISETLIIPCPSEAEHILAVLRDGSEFSFSRSCGAETKVVKTVNISQYVPLLI